MFVSRKEKSQVNNKLPSQEIRAKQTQRKQSHGNNKGKSRNQGIENWKMLEKIIEMKSCFFEKIIKLTDI